MRKYWRCWVIPLTILLSFLLLWIPLGGHEEEASYAHASMATLSFDSAASEAKPMEESSDTWEPIEVAEPKIHPILEEQGEMSMQEPEKEAPQGAPAVEQQDPVPTAPSPSEPSSASKGNALRAAYAELDGQTIAPQYRNFKLQYPAMARRRGIEGTVLVAVYVSALGVIDRVQVLEDPGYGFGEAVMEAFRKAEASPARRKGKALAVVQRIPIKFTLR